MTIAVAGATGNAGREIVRALASRGLNIRALVRAPERLGAVGDLCEEIAVVDVTNPSSLHGALNGTEGLVSALGKTRQKDKTPRRAVDVDANRNLFAESVRARLKRIALISVACAAHDHPAVIDENESGCRGRVERNRAALSHRPAQRIFFRLVGRLRNVSLRYLLLPRKRRNTVQSDLSSRPPRFCCKPLPQFVERQSHFVCRRPANSPYVGCRRDLSGYPETTGPRDPHPHLGR
jgi:nucleoside-diphosphate-sugar epimerase